MMTPCAPARSWSSGTNGLIGHGVTSVFAAAGYDMQLEELFRPLRRQG